MLRELGAGLIVGDIPPLAFAVGAAAGIPSIAIGNFTWDWVYSEYPRVRLAPSLLPAIRGAYAKASMALRLPRRLPLAGSRFRFSRPMPVC